LECGVQEIGCVADAVLGDSASREKLQAAFDDGAKGEKLLNAAGDAESDSNTTKMVVSCFSSTQMVDKIDKDESVDGLMGLANEQTDSTGATKIAAAAISCFGVGAFGS
jgi:hypothetical protein